MRRFAFIIAAFALIMLARAQAENAPTPTVAPAPAPAAAPAPSVFSTINRTAMMALMQQAGLTSVSDGTTDEAAPWLEGRMSNDFPVVVNFYVCEAGVTGPQRQCPYLAFKVTWNNTKNTDAAAVNKYTEQKVFSRGGVTTDGKYVYIDYSMNLEGGVTSDHIVKNLSYFMRTVTDFASIVNP
jgi:hypothetical protein